MTQAGGAEAPRPRLEEASWATYWEVLGPALLREPQCRTNLAAECGMHQVHVRATAVVWVSGDYIKKAHCICVKSKPAVTVCSLTVPGQHLVYGP